MLVDDAISRRVLACCYNVHRELGTGFACETYKRAVTRELERAELIFLCDATLPVLFYEEEIDRVSVDFVLDRLLLLLRAQSSLEREDVAFAQACLRISGKPRCLLINFGADEIQIRRLTNTPKP